MKILIIKKFRTPIWKVNLNRSKWKSFVHIVFLLFILTPISFFILFMHKINKKKSHALIDVIILRILILSHTLCIILKYIYLYYMKICYILTYIHNIAYICKTFIFIHTFIVVYLHTGGEVFTAFSFPLKCIIMYPII